MAVITPSLAGSVTVARTGTPAAAPNTLTFSHTVPAGVDVLFVYVHHDSFDTTAPSVTWLGTTVPCIHRPSGPNQSLYILIHPTAGTGNIVVFHNSAFTATLCAAAFQVNDFGAIRFAEFNSNLWFESNPEELATSIYTHPSDLVLSFFTWGASGQTVTADAGQTILATHSGAGDAGRSVAVGQVNNLVNPGYPAIEANFTSVEWNTTSVPFLGNVANYLLAIKGIDREAPVGAHASIGRVTDTMTVSTPNETAIADNPWVWRHEVPFSHTTLVVLIQFFDQGTDFVYWRPDSTGVEVALTPLLDLNAGDGVVYALEDAATGLGYIRVVNVNRRSYGATAVSISGENLIADIYRGESVSPGFNAGGMEIESVVGGIVIDRIGHLIGEFKQWTPGDGGSGQNGLFDEPIYGVLNGDPAAAGSLSGSSSWTVAVAVSTKMDWLEDPDNGFNGQVGISYTPITPPEEPPEEDDEPECPETFLTETPLTGLDRLFSVHGDGVYRKITVAAECLDTDDNPALTALERFYRVHG
jgi:hypothetical protein